MAGGGNLEGGEPDFQIAPMVDVLLVILIFFMTITSAQVLRVDKSIQLPVAQNATKKDNMRQEAIVNVRWDADKKAASFVFDDRVYSRAADLVSPLNASRAAASKATNAASDPEFRAVIRGDKSVPVRHVTAAMNACAEAGISDISFSATNHE